MASLPEIHTPTQQLLTVFLQKWLWWKEWNILKIKIICLFLQTSWGISFWRDQFLLLCGRIRSGVQNKRIKVCKGTVAWAAARTEREEPVWTVLCPSLAAESLAQPESFLLLHFAARKIPHPPSGCRKRSYSLWMHRHQKQRGDCGAGGGRGLRASVPGPGRQHPREPALPAHSPTALPSPTLQGV